MTDKKMMASLRENGRVSEEQFLRWTNAAELMNTLDNRRHEAFRRAEMNVPYRMATPEESASEVWKFTTRNEGTSIRIRGE